MLNLNFPYIDKLIEELFADTILVAYHANCNDGYTAFWAFDRWATLENPEVKAQIYSIPMEYTDASYEELVTVCIDKAIDHVYILDFNVPIETLRNLRQIPSVRTITVLDHHKKAFETYFDADPASEPRIESNDQYDVFRSKGYADTVTRIVLDNNESGASLTWKYLHPEVEGYGYSDVPKLITYVRDRDLWEHKFKLTNPVHHKLLSIPKSIANWEEVHSVLADYLKPAAQKGWLADAEKIYAEYEAKIASLAKGGHIYTSGKYESRCSFYIVTAPYSLASDVCAEAMKRLDIDFCVSICTKSDTSIYLSLRSNKEKDYDVCELAKLFGGGGHKYAAGAIIELNEIMPYNLCIPQGLDDSVKEAIDLYIFNITGGKIYTDKGDLTVLEVK